MPHRQQSLTPAGSLPVKMANLAERLRFVPSRAEPGDPRGTSGANLARSFSTAAGLTDGAEQHGGVGRVFPGMQCDDKALMTSLCVLQEQLHGQADAAAAAASLACQVSSKGQ